MEAVWDLQMTRSMGEKFGFEGISVVEAREMEVVKGDEVFWREFVERPGFSCVVGTKVVD